MKAALVDRKCPYCGEWFTPMRTNQPCCSSKICYALHKKAWHEEYRAIPALQTTIGRHYVRKPYIPKRPHDCTCFFCKSAFPSKSKTAMCCTSPSCQRKMEARKKNISRKWNTQNRKEQSEKRLLAQKVASIDGKTFAQSLGQVGRNLRETIMENWVDAVFDLTDQIHLLFMECQHLRGSSSPLLASCLHEGTPSGCWSLHTLNRQRHVC